MGAGHGRGGPLTRFVAHLDLDAFYASVEELDYPEYAGHPLVVGADPQGGRGRGVVATANYAARAFGVRSAMPIQEAWRRCPQARYVRPRFPRYQEKSDEVYALLHEASDAVEAAGIDEAYLELTARAATFDDAVEQMQALQRRVHEQTGLTASIGVATSKTVAKIASDARKPHGLTPVRPGTEAEFLAPLAARRIPGIGPKSEARLLELGILTCGDLAALSPQRLLDLFGSWGPRLGELARGVDDSPLVTTWERKSLGSETTFLQDVDDPLVVERTLDELASDLAASLVRESKRARTWTVKVRLTGFETYTRARTLAAPIADAPEIARIARQLLRENPPTRPVRLLGLRATGLEGPEADDAAQLRLTKWDAAQLGEDEGRRRRATLADWPADVLGESPPWKAPQQTLDQAWSDRR